MNVTLTSVLIAVTWNVFHVRHTDLYLELDLSFSTWSYDNVWHGCSRNSTEKCIFTYKFK